MREVRAHLPTTRDELAARGWRGVDVLLVTGDAHVDHPSFPAALLGRWLEAHGFRVGVIARPDPDDPSDLARLGPPRLFVGVTAGALDSMVANYTALKRRRSDDPYAPGGVAGGRPDRALTVYAQLARRAFGRDVLIVGGGLEASLRRVAHYDFWSDKVRRSVLMDAGADLLVQGMGEGPIVAIARALNEAERRGVRGREAWVDALREIPGVVHRTPRSAPAPAGSLALPPAEDVAADPRAHVEAWRLAERHRERVLTQDTGGMRVIVQPAAPLSSADLDRAHTLPFTRDPHPMYGDAPIPALPQVRFSVSSHRGCFGGCAFCAIGAHQGKGITSRSPASVRDEVRAITAHPDFKGTIPDLGGPTANMYGMGCTRPPAGRPVRPAPQTSAPAPVPPGAGEPCDRPSCLWPTRCRHLATDHEPYRRLLADTAALPGVKHLFVTTGIRMDLALLSEPFVCDLAQRYTSGHLKVAPEHLSAAVLAHMRKPEGGDFARFLTLYRRQSERAGKQQYALPYLMAAHPGSRLEDMLEVALFLADTRTRVEQVQIFTPTPGTAATVMYATGLDPATGGPVFVERSDHGKRLQKALLLAHLPDQAPLAREALRALGRGDLIPRLLPAGKSRDGRKRKA